MEIIRIGSKLISIEKINRVIEKILRLRVQGYSQQEVGHELKVDRTFVSRLERLGEIRKGEKIAVIGFPIDNKAELEETLVRKGVEYTLILTDEERWDFVRNRQGIEIFNSVMEIIRRLRNCDVVIVIASNYRIQMCEELIDKEVVGVEIGKSPIEKDKQVSIENIEKIVDSVMLKKVHKGGFDGGEKNS